MKTSSLKRTLGRALTVGAVLALASCSDSTGPEEQVCGRAGAIVLNGGSCLLFMDGGLLEDHRETIEQTVAATFDTVRRVLPVDGVEVRVLAGTRAAIPEIGIGGRAFGRDVVEMTLDPASPHLEASLPTLLFSLLAHELHHIARERTAGYGVDLLGAMISEGLADHFSVEIAGVEEPLWSVALTGPDLDTWIARSEATWSNQAYNHDAWFFGVGATIPRWAGYSIGYELVRAFLSANPDRAASDLHDEPTASFIP